MFSWISDLGGIYTRVLTNHHNLQLQTIADVTIFWCRYEIRKIYNYSFSFSTKQLYCPSYFEPLALLYFQYIYSDPALIVKNDNIIYQEICSWKSFSLKRPGITYIYDTKQKG